MKFNGYNFDRKFTVIKNEDINKYLSTKEKVTLAGFLTRIRKERENEDKNSNNTYLVVNTDESYANEIAEIIAKNEEVEEIKRG